MNRFKVLNVSTALVLFVACQQTQAQMLDVINTGLGFAEDIVTADACKTPTEKVKGALAGNAGLLVGTAIGIPAMMMTDSVSKGFKVGKYVAGITALAVATTGMANKKELEDTLSKPSTLERKRDFELCKIMENQRAQLRLILENLQNQIAPPCIYTVVGNPGFSAGHSA
jgi:hypothetical protein